MSVAKAKKSNNVNNKNTNNNVSLHQIHTNLIQSAWGNSAREEKRREPRLKRRLKYCGFVLWWILESHKGNIVHGATALLHDHVRKFSHFDFGVISLFHQVHHRQRGAFHHRTFPLAVGVNPALWLPAAPCTAERLIPCRLDHPVLRPGQSAEINEVFLPAAHILTSVWLAVAMWTRESREVTIWSKEYYVQSIQ